MKKQILIIILLTAFVLTSGCFTPETQQNPVPYPWDNQNMFFGFSMLKDHDNPTDREKVEFFDPKWVSLQPHVLWFMIEKEPGAYNWESLDEEIKWLQSLDLDITLLHSYLFNSFNQTEKQEILNTLIQLKQERNYSSLGSAFIAWSRELNGAKEYDLWADPFDPTDEKMQLLINFIKAVAERYDGDGIDDMPGLKYAVRSHELIREWPNPKTNETEYIAYLKLLSPAIKEANPNAIVIAPGLLTSFGRIYAYADGFIDDPDAGVIDGKNYTRQQLQNNQVVQKRKQSYESVLIEGYTYYDVIDFHLYPEKETFIEGLIDYLNHYMSQAGTPKPIWSCEGGGPFKNAPGDYEGGDTYFGWFTLKENAEFAVKMHVLPAAKGMERQHWSWGLDYTCSGDEGQGYWQGPWAAMDQVAPCDVKKPAYYTFKLVREKLRDFEIGNVKDLSIGSVRIFEFKTPNGKVYVAWDSDGDDQYASTNLTSIYNGNVKVTYIVTEIDENNNPIQKDSETRHTSNIPISITPIFIEKV